MNFGCPNCSMSYINKADDRYLKFDEERVMGSDALNADPLTNISTKIELWYCCHCGIYFRVYYQLNKITKLIEKED